jgi:hypothetical protein
LVFISQPSSDHKEVQTSHYKPLHLDRSIQLADLITTHEHNLSKTSP